MATTGKAVGVMTLCLVIAGMAWLGHNNAPPTVAPIKVSAEAFPAILKTGEQAKIVLQAHTGDSGLSHGEVVLDFYPLDLKSSEYYASAWTFRGYTDAQGRYITHWKVPCAGKYVIAVKVNKHGCTSGTTVCYLTVLDEPTQAKR